jgi:hypothetical protein
MVLLLLWKRTDGCLLFRSDEQAPDFSLDIQRDLVFGLKIKENNVTLTAEEKVDFVKRGFSQRSFGRIAPTSPPGPLSAPCGENL